MVAEELQEHRLICDALGADLDIGEVVDRKMSMSLGLDLSKLLLI